ncbi:hypothetical protein H5P28_11810 [Ruficoccus amylovorans]|uniref:Uncharacterized protein n=1 Tax=Ruficoccus amylovorans TaxID=1804625 RepID=A0A842HEJ6_9BACT|nr:hypothetical protein [Ruficoccus amylovorans]MBC2594943.1 hypothetical protein [Ruficoccus amylovorans]
MKSNVQISETQLSGLKAYLERRETSLRTDNRQRINADRKSILDYRNCKDRKSGVFAKENLSWPLLSMVVDHFIVRTEDEITGTAPYFNFKPEGMSDADKALAADKYFRFRLDKMGQLRARIEDAYFPIFTQRAAIFKATYEEIYDEWEERGRLVLHDADGPIEVLDRGIDDTRYILFGDEEWVPQSEPVIMEPGQEPVVTSYRLAIDPSIEIPAELYEADPGDPAWEDSPYQWAALDEPIRFREYAFAGPRSDQVDYDRFFAPSKIRCLTEADALFEEYDKPLHWIRDRWMKRKGMDWASFEANLKAQGQTGTSGEDAINGETFRDKADKEGETQIEDAEETPFRIQEWWIERDVLGWGKPQRLVVWREKQSGEIILVEFAAVVMPDRRGRIPYDAIAIWKQEEYWWGYSLPEMLDQYQDQVDKIFNAWLFRSKIQNGSLIGVKPDKTIGGVKPEDVQPFETVELQADANIDDWLQIKNFPQTDARTAELMGMIIQAVQLWLGVSNIAQGDLSNTKTNTTAYGVDATLREAGKLSRRWTRRIIRGLTSHIRKLVMIEVATMDEVMAYAYTEGNEEFIGWMKRASLQTNGANIIDWDVQVVVSQQYTQTTVEANRLVLEIIEKYAASDPLMRLRIRLPLKQSLIALGHDEVDQMLPMPTEQEIAAYQQMQANMADRLPQEGEAQPMSA